MKNIIVFRNLMLRLLKNIGITIGISILFIGAICIFTLMFILLIDFIIIIAFSILLCMAAIDLKRYIVQLWHEEKNKLNY
jgi:hypothetical protein